MPSLLETIVTPNKYISASFSLSVKKSTRPELLFEMFAFSRSQSSTALNSSRLFAITFAYIIKPRRATIRGCFIDDGNNAFLPRGFSGRGR